MAKKVLVVEESLAVRGIAESLLRQNGYEVFSAASAEEARTIIRGSRIELVLVSSTASDPAGRRFVDTLGGDPSTASLPLLILHDPTAGESGYPLELIIHKPFTPREFLDAVASKGTFRPVPPAQPASPFEGAALEDDIIDAALGLDRLEVDESKVIGDDTGAFRILNAKPTKETMIGFEYGASSPDDSGAVAKKVDQISIKDSGATPVPPKAAAGDAATDNQAPEGFSGSGKIEIVSDQYGMITPPEMQPPMFEDAVPRTHDYDWFIKELKREGTAPLEGAPPKAAGDSGPVKVAGKADTIPPVVPPAPTPPSHQTAIDKFISEFKREIENIPETPIPTVAITPPREAAARQSDADASGLGWREAIEQISPNDIKLLSRELIEAVSARVAERILSNLDQETVYRILTECFREILDQKMTKSGRP
jgi:CheY-like chemotaxis protein